MPDEKLLDGAMVLAPALGGLEQAQLWQTRRVFQRSLLMEMGKALGLARGVSVMMGRSPA